MTANAGLNNLEEVTGPTDDIKLSAHRLALATDALTKSEERAIAGRLALETMHEIKNPLEALGHLTYLALQEADSPDMVRKYMQLANEQMATLCHIAKQTLGFAQQSEELMPVDLLVLAEAALRIHQKTIAEKRIHLVKDLQTDAVTNGHRGEILQVVSNLLVNALDALPEKGALHLRLRKRRGQLEILIADNGHGIPKNHSEDVFKPFFTTKGSEGTGLGLALAKRIIERHNGRIRLRSSVMPGRSGTAFKIYLPCR